MNFSAAVFDLDGTLADSNPVWEKLDRIILQRLDITVSDDFLKSLAAMTYENAAKEICALGGNITADEFRREINVLAVYEYANNIPLKNGASDYLKSLKCKGISLSLATASPPELYEGVLKRNGVYDLFDAFTTTDEAGKGKNCPDIYFAAARKASVRPENCIVFEDTAEALQSAKKAGMFTVCVYDECSSRDVPYMKSISDKFIYSFNEML
jgi:HAD superfamily hydrolase (TIGR01509 family)